MFMNKATRTQVLCRHIVYIIPQMQILIYSGRSHSQHSADRDIGERSNKRSVLNAPDGAAAPGWSRGYYGSHSPYMALSECANPEVTAGCCGEREERMTDAYQLS